MSRKTKALRLADWQATENARITASAMIKEVSGVSYDIKSHTKRDVLLEDLRHAHTQLKLRMEATVLAYDLAQTYGATDPSRVSKIRSKRPDLCALNQIKRSFFNDLAKLRAMVTVISELQVAC